MKKPHDHIPFTDIEEKILHAISEQRDKTAKKFPLGFGLAASFGLVSTYYGFEAMIDRVAWLNNNPWAMLLVGVGTLIATGTMYRKLG
jgi:hypothetical protein